LLLSVRHAIPQVFIILLPVSLLLTVFTGANVAQ
jgi:hypothetical protein